MKLHLPPTPRARAHRRERRPKEAETLPDAAGEQRLARMVRDLSGAQLVGTLRLLPRCEQRVARVIVIRELGPRRAGPLLAQLLGERSVGRPVPQPLREKLREIVGNAVDAARLHEGEEAAALAAAHSARALAVGDHIFFAEPPDAALIAHEVAHVAQSRCGKLSHAAAKAVDGGPADAAELEADVAAQAVVSPAPNPSHNFPPPATPSGLAESEGQRAAQLAAQAQRLQVAPAQKGEAAAAATPAPTPVVEKPVAAVEPAKPPAGAATKSAYLDLFAKKPSQQAAEWTKVKEDFSDKQPLPKLPVKLDGKEAKPKPAADAAGKDGTIDMPAAAPPPELKPAPPKAGPPLPKPPEVKVASDDKAAVESAGKKAIEAIPTKDPHPPPKAGPAPVVELAGETDPVRAASAESDGVAESQKQAAAAKAKIVEGPGAGAVQPKQLDEQLAVPPPEPAPPLPAPQPVEGMEELRGYGLDAPALQAFDDVAKPKLEAHLSQARTQLEQATQKRDKDRSVAIADAQKKTAEANRDAAKKQGDEVGKARKSIVDEQKTTIHQQQKAVADLKQQSGVKRTDVTGKIDARVKADQQQIAGAYQDADKKSQEEHRRAEEEAKKKKLEAQEQSKDKSWWQRAKEAVASAIKSLADAVCDILAKARDAVCKLIDAAKQLACRMIDAARDFIKSAIGAFGDWLKSQVSSLLGSLFPGLAARLNAFIDRAVNAAKRAVDAVADGLKKGVTALCDGLKAAVKAAVGLLQSAVRAAAALATAFVTGDWRAVARMVLEGILKAIGVDPAQFWALIAKAESSLKKILKNPRGFVGNLISAVKSGFSLFAKNLWTHLKNGFVSWLFNTVSTIGITIPGKLDVSGIFDVVGQVLGLTRDKLELKAKKLIGEKNVERIKKVMAHVEPLVKSGIGGLWEKIQQDLAGLKEAVIGPIKTFLVEKVVEKAVITIAMMFNPAGAIAQLIHMAWKVYCWLRDNAQRIMGLVQSVVDSIGEIVDGKLDKAAKLVDQSLGKLVPIAIDLLAKIMGLGGIGEKVKEILGNLHKRIDDAIDKLLQRFVKQAGDGKKDEVQVPKSLAFPRETRLDKLSPELQKSIAQAKSGDLLHQTSGSAKDITKKLLDKHTQAKLDKGSLKLTLPALDAGALSSAANVKQLGERVAAQTGVGKVTLEKSDSSFKVRVHINPDQKAASGKAPAADFEEKGTMAKAPQVLKVQVANKKIELNQEGPDGAVKKAKEALPGQKDPRRAEAAQLLLAIEEKLKKLPPKLQAGAPTDEMKQLAKEVMTALQAFGDKFEIRRLGQKLKEFPSPQIGIYTDKDSAAGKLPDCTTRQSHHVPPVRLAKTIKETVDRIGTAFAGVAAPDKKAEYAAAATQLTSAATSVDTRLGGHGADLSTIFIHRSTHLYSDEAVHSKNLSGDIKKELDLEPTCKATQDKRIKIMTKMKGDFWEIDKATKQKIDLKGADKSDPKDSKEVKQKAQQEDKEARQKYAAAREDHQNSGELSVNPQRTQWADFLGACRNQIDKARNEEVQKQKQEAQKKGEEEEKKLTDKAKIDIGKEVVERLRRTIRTAFHNSLDQALAALKTALERSQVDGPADKHPATLSAMRKRATDTWASVRNVIPKSEG